MHMGIRCGTTIKQPGRRTIIRGYSQNALRATAVDTISDVVTPVESVNGDGRKQSIDTWLISTPALTHLHQFLTYCPMRLTVAPCSYSWVLRLRKFARVFGTTMSLRLEAYFTYL